MTQPQLRTQFKAPAEGRYQLVSERTTGLVGFSPHRVTRLTLAELTTGDDAGTYILFSVGDCLNICRYEQTDKAPYRQISFGTAASGVLVMPTSHSYAPAADGMDVLIGLSTGDIVVCSLQAQLSAPATSTKLVTMVHFNVDGAVDASRCNAVAWLPGSDGGLFVTAHSSGNLHVFHKNSSSANGSSEAAAPPAKLPSASKTGAGRPPQLSIPVGGGGLTGVAASPDGSRMATASRDGVMRVFDVATGALLTGFKAYYGGLLCVAWSQNGRYIATGGEDDLVCLFGLAERAVVAWGEGHTSWVSAVAFDPWRTQTADHPAASPDGSPPAQPPLQPPGGPLSLSHVGSGALSPVVGDAIYRVASAGQDCQMALWDFTVSDDILPPLASIKLPPGSPLPTIRQAPSDPSVDNSRATSFHTAASSTPMSSKSGASGGGGSANGTPTFGAHRGGDSMSGMAPVGSGAIAPAAPRVEMTVFTPIMLHRLHMEPMSDILFTREAIFTACQSAQVKCWRRPTAADQAAAMARADSVQSMSDAVTRSPSHTL